MTPKRLIDPRLTDPFRFFIFFMLFGLVALAAACANSPLSLAETVEQKYDAVRLTYDALLTPAVAAIEDEALPIEARRQIQSLVQQSATVYALGIDLYVEYRAARAAFAAGDSPESRLRIATDNLERWADRLETVLDSIALAL